MCGDGISVPSVQFFCESKINTKIKFIVLKNYSTILHIYPLEMILSHL